MTAALAVWRVLRPILTFGVTLPVWLFMAAGVWLWWDKTSAVRQAVDTAVVKLVDGAELEAARAELAAMRAINERRDAEAAADRAALRSFAELLANADDESQAQADYIDRLERSPVNPRCEIDQPLFDRVTRP